MEDYIERIERWHEKTRRIKAFERIIFLKKKKLAELREQCPHEVVVCIRKQSRVEGTGVNAYVKCLFCGKETIDESVFDNSEVIDVSEFKSANNYNEITKFRIANAKFIRFVERNPELSVADIVRKINQQIKSEDELFRKKTE